MTKEEWKRAKFNRRSENIFRNHKRRAKDANIPILFSLADVRELAAKAIGMPCLYCGLQVTEKNFSIDHIVPLQRGGQHTKDNLDCICDRCNQIKGNMTRGEYLAILTTANDLHPDAKRSLFARLRAGSRFIYN